MDRTRTASSLQSAFRDEQCEERHQGIGRRDIGITQEDRERGESRMMKRTMRWFPAIVVCVLAFALTVSAAPPQVVPPEPLEVAAVRAAVDANIDAYSARMIEMSDWMYHNPEPGFLEFKASAMLTEELKENGFEVETGVPSLDPKFDEWKVIGGLSPDYSGPSGLPTAFKAKYKGKSEHPIIAFMVEYDALRGNPPFHGCQHNQQGPAGVGAAIALAKVMEEKGIPGSVWVIGTPAEEVGPPTKSAMAKAGYFDGVDFIIRSHGTARTTARGSGGFSSMSIRQMKYTFHGKSAHAAAAWGGRSALDAVFLLFHGIEMLREHSEPQFRFHGVVTDGGVAPNIVPEMASATIWVRHFIDETRVGAVSPRKAGEMIDAKVEQMNNIAKGAALATGTTVDIAQYGVYVPSISVGAFNDLAFQYAVDYGGANVQEKPGPPSGWDETGLVSLVAPGVQVSVGVDGIPETAGHSQQNADITITPEGHKGLILTARVMAATGLRLAMDADMRDKITAEHAAWLAKYNE